MASRGKKEFVYEGFTLPRLTVKKLLASNARGDSELQNFHKQLDKEKEELETDFSKTRSQLLSRALDHQMILEPGESYVDSGSDEEHSDIEFENGADDHMIASETTSFVTLKDISSSQDTLNRNSKHKQSWADKVAYFEQSLATKNEPVTWKSQQVGRKISWGGRANVYVENVDAKSEQLEQCVGAKSKPAETSSKSHNKRKISWGGRANVYIENWDAKSEVSRASSEENLSSGVTCSRGGISHVRVRKHPVGERSFTTKHSGLTKEALQKYSSSTSKQLARRHTVCCRPKRIEPAAEESCPDKKPLSDLLPPIKLPPIYLQETARKKVQGTRGDRHVINNHVKNGVSKCSTQDLHYCRYLRIKRTDSEEYPW